MSENAGRRVAIVTGGSRGIGFAVARALVDRGDRVCLTARRQETLDAAVAELGGPAHAIGIAGKADDQDHQAQTVAATMDAFGRVDMLVNNAGVNLAYGALMDLDLGAARKICEVNLIGTLGWVQQVHGAWLRDHGGAIVNVSSAAGVRPATGIGFYGATKAALMQLTEQLAIELAPDVRVNAVAPAVVRTTFATALYEGREDSVAARYPLGRFGVPPDVADAVAFLLSEQASWITGQTVVIDGGLSLAGGID